MARYTSEIGDALLQIVLGIVNDLRGNAGPGTYDKHAAALIQLSGEEVPDHLKGLLPPAEADKKESN